MKHLLRVTVAALLIAMLPAAARAQNSKWSDPYSRALDAFKANRYQEAINLLETAVKANPKAEANKRIEGVFTVDYYPYYYLGIAYYETRDYRKAQENLEKAKAPAPRDKAMVAKLNEYQQKTQVALNPPKPAQETPTQIARTDPDAGRPPTIESKPTVTGTIDTPDPKVTTGTTRSPDTGDAKATTTTSRLPETGTSKATASSGLADSGTRTSQETATSALMKNSLRTALRALFQGDLQTSISMLEPLARQKGSAADMATVHAYLGVAYATRALSAKTLDEGSRWTSTASEQFKLAVAAQTTFQLSSRMVSPKIVSMFNQARQ
jgi:tetratricopeptide (TPR) repeat protein